MSTRIGTEVYRIWSAHLPLDAEFYTQTRYRNTYDEAISCLQDDDCLNGVIYLDDIILESKDRDEVWSLGLDAKFITVCNNKPFWNKNIQDYETSQDSR